MDIYEGTPPLTEFLVSVQKFPVCASYDSVHVL